MLQTGGAEPSPAQPSQATPAATRGSPPAQPSPAHRPPPPQHTRYLDTGHLDTRCGVRTGDAAPRPANCCSLLAALWAGRGGAGLCSGRVFTARCRRCPAPRCAAAGRRDPCVRTGAAQLCTAARRPEHTRHQHRHTSSDTSTHTHQAHADGSFTIVFYI